MSVWRERRVRLALRRSGLFALAVVFLFVVSGRAAEERAVKSRVAPAYPEIARRMRISGIVKLEVTVDAEGKVRDVRPLSGNGMLSTAAQDAVRKWRFASGPEQTVMELELNFNLGQ
ncbi:MAG: energy transducer TonB [Terracidiphilus sp.]